MPIKQERGMEIKDPLKDYYHDLIENENQRKKNFKDHGIALLTIDMQYLDAAEGYGVFKDILKSGIPPEAEEYYFSTLKGHVIPNIRKLQDYFRELEMEVVHIRIQALTLDGRDRSNGHKKLGLMAVEGSKEAEFLPEVAPKENEIVINKTSSGVFNSTNLHYVLRNLDIREIFVVGVYTNECVETTVRDACDLGYMVTLVDDACTTVNKELHKASIKTLRDRYARILKADEVISSFKKELELMNSYKQ